MTPVTEAARALLGAVEKCSIRTGAIEVRLAENDLRSALDAQEKGGAPCEESARTGACGHGHGLEDAPNPAPAKCPGCNRAVESCTGQYGMCVKPSPACEAKGEGVLGGHCYEHGWFGSTACPEPVHHFLIPAKESDGEHHEASEVSQGASERPGALLRDEAAVSGRGDGPCRGELGRSGGAESGAIPSPVGVRVPGVPSVAHDEPQPVAKDEGERVNEIIQVMLDAKRAFEKSLPLGAHSAITVVNGAWEVMARAALGAMRAK